MDSIVSQVTKLAAEADPTSRQNIVATLRKLVRTLETKDDVVRRIAHELVDMSMAKIGYDLNLFHILVEMPQPMTLEQIQQRCGASPQILGRILRYLASISLIEETGKDTFTASNTTHHLADTGARAAITHHFKIMGPVYYALPAYFERYKYQDMTESDSPFESFYKDNPGKIDFFNLPPGDPDLENFNVYMAEQRRYLKTWLDAFPFKEELRDWKPTESHEVLFVDVGGGLGHQCKELKAKYPDVPGRVILQDRPNAVRMALKTPGVEAMVHDFTTPQPIKNARFYYSRLVLHDWPDDKVITILTHLLAAMGEDSAILIDEKILPQSGVHWKGTQMDIDMFLFGACERSQGQWTKLFDAAGLKIARVYVYEPSTYDSVMVVLKK